MLPQKRSNFTSFSEYMDAKESKLRSQFASTIHQQSNLLQGVCVHVNGRTQPPLEQLREMVLTAGGSFEQYYHASTVTHILCTHIPRAKELNAPTNFLKKLVKPQWIVDSLREGRVMELKPYLLYPSIGGSGSEIRDFFKGAEIGIEEEKEEDDDDVQLLANLMDIEDIEDGLVEEEQKDNYNIESNENTNENINQNTNAMYDEKAPLNSLTSASPSFLNDFYKNSRLHHLSTWRQEAKALVKSLLLKKKPSNTPLATDFLLTCHVDLDCFFVAASLLSHPHLDPSSPIAVCHSTSSSSDSTNSSSDISSCNYPARAFGVRNGMYLREAKQLCPHLQLIPYDFDAYRRVMHNFYAVLVEAAAGHCCWPVSCDEAYIQVTDESEIAALRHRISQVCGIEASIGAGTNRLIARLATRKAKPAGQFIVRDGDAFMADQLIAHLPGIGDHVMGKIGAAFGVGVERCQDLLQKTVQQLQGALGFRTGLKVFNAIRGIDSADDTNNEGERRSVGSEVSWGVRFESTGQVKRFVNEMSQEVWNRLKVELGEAEELGDERDERNERIELANPNPKINPRKVSIKVYRRRPGAPEPKKFLGRGICDCLHRSRSFTKGTTIKNAERLAEEAWLLLEQLMRKVGFGAEDVRGVGIFCAEFQEKEKIGGMRFERGFGRDEIDPEVWAQLPADIQAELRGIRIGLVSGVENAKENGIASTSGISIESKITNTNTTNTIANPITTKSKSKSKPIKPNINTLTQMWGVRERRHLESLQTRILALPASPAYDRQVLLALPAEMQQELLEEIERQHVIKPSETIIPVREGVSPRAQSVVPCLPVTFRGKSDWTQFSLYCEIKNHPQGEEVEALLVELAMRGCLKALGELCGLVARDLAEKVVALVKDLHGSHLKY